jgi:hypothetical protein
VQVDRLPSALVQPANEVTGRRARSPLPLVRSRDEVSGQQEHQAEAEGGVHCAKGKECVALGPVVHGPGAAAGAVSLGGMVHDHEGDDRDPQHIGEHEALRPAP